MPLRLVQRRTVWFPTLTGWVLLGVLVIGPLILWWFCGERFLAVTDRRAAEVLIVEGWIDGTGIHAAYAEYRAGGYKLIVTTGGLTGERWSQRRWNYAVEAEERLLRLGVARDRLIPAPSREAEIQRTFEMAVAARQALQAKGINPTAINVFTRGAHARRSRLIFEKVFGPETPVGIISWKPPYFAEESWWQSSERAEDMVKETVGYFFELLFNSGRHSNAVNTPDPERPVAVATVYRFDLGSSSDRLLWIGNGFVFTGGIPRAIRGSERSTPSTDQCLLLAHGTHRRHGNRSAHFVGSTSVRPRLDSCEADRTDLI